MELTESATWPVGWDRDLGGVLKRSSRAGASEINGADGISDIEGKVTRVGASERGQRMSFNVAGAGLQLPDDALQELNHIAG